MLFITPDLAGLGGGIARNGRTVCSALLDAGVGVNVVALHDRASARVTVDEMFPSLTYFPCEGSKATFVRHALWAARRRPSLVLVGHANFAALGLLVARMAGARLVMFGYGTEIWRPLPLLQGLAVRTADLVICISHFTASRAMQSNGLAPEKTRVLHLCLAPEFPLRPPPVTHSPNLSILTVARMSASEQYKGHAEIIRALPALLLAFPGLTYDVVGDGDGRSDLERLALALGVEDAVHFHGAVSERELAGYYANASIFAMPSRGEGFGLAFLEAMAHGKPVVAGNQDASPEVVRDGDTGLLVDPSDVPALTAALGRLLADADLRRRLGTRGSELVASDFSYDTYRTRLMNCLDAVASRPEPASALG